MYLAAYDPRALAKSTVKARAYIARLRNPRKQAYAAAYLPWLLGEPAAVQPDASDFGLSVMGGQAVRIALAKFV